MSVVFYFLLLPFAKQKRSRSDAKNWLIDKSKKYSLINMVYTVKKCPRQHFYSILIAVVELSLYPKNLFGPPILISGGLK